MPFPLLAAIAPAAAMVASGAFSAYSQAESQRDTNTANAMMNDRNIMVNLEESQRNRDFQERMSNSAWQRGVEDMRKAGINPMAAFSSGGASTPSGGAASSGSTHAMQTVPSMFASGLSTAMEMFRTFAQVSKDKATTVNVNTDTRKKRAEIPNVEADTERIYQDALHKTMQSREIDASLPSARAHAFSDINRMRAESKFPRTFGFTDAILRRLGIVGTAAKAAVAYKLLSR